jgi:hypothetical protein
MTRLTTFAVVTILMLGTVACGRNTNDAPDNGTTTSEIASPTGTGGDLQQSASSSEAAAPVAEGNLTGEELPATASPLPLAALLGLTSLGAAMGIRFIGRR